MVDEIHEDTPKDHNSFKNEKVGEKKSNYNLLLARVFTNYSMIET